MADDAPGTRRLGDPERGDADAPAKAMTKASRGGHGVYCGATADQIGSHDPTRLWRSVAQH